ncbi:MAG: hypothetical protein P8X50_16200 [Maritimibacter sp.]
MAQPLHTLDDAINRMRHLVGARHWDSADWRALLNDPVLDFADAGQQFERALVQLPAVRPDPGQLAVGYRLADPDRRPLLLEIRWDAFPQ